MQLDEELAQFFEGQISALGWDGAVIYGIRCIPFWRAEYGDAIADRATARIRKSLRDRRPRRKAEGDRRAEVAVAGQGPPSGEGEEGDEEAGDAGAQLGEEGR